MHEVHAVKNIIEVIKSESKQKKLGKISKINVVLGKMSGISKENFSFWFDELSKDTPAYGAKIEFKEPMDANVYLESIEI